MKKSSKQCVITKILHLYLQRDYDINSLNRKMTADMNKNSLAYSTRDINRNFRIKVAGVDNEGNKINMLVGVSGALKLIGVELLNKFLKRAFSCMDDVCVCKLRRGLKFSFYIK